MGTVSGGFLKHTFEEIPSNTCAFLMKCLTRRKRVTLDEQTRGPWVIEAEVAAAAV